MNVLESFGEKLHTLRVEKGLTQRQLADALFITRKTVSNWEAGIRMPDVIMGGTLEIQSSKESGTLVTIIIPASPNQSSPAVR